MHSLKIADRNIGPGEPTYIIAEMSANHLMDLERAHAIVEAAAKAGVDAVKLQTYTADTLTYPGDSEIFTINSGTIWDGRTLYDLYQEAHTPWAWQPELKEHAERLGLACFSSPFDPTSVDFLESMDVPAYKIASFEIVDIPLISRVASTGKPILLATGIARLEDIARAVEACRAVGNDEIALLKCTSAYPSPYEEINLKTMPNLSQTFDVVAGLSDHTMGYEVAVAAVALGACIVEKHLTLNRADGGPDGAFSMEPDEFAAMVSGIRHVEKALGKVSYELTSRQVASRGRARSLFVVEDVEAGSPFDEFNVRSIRPAGGLEPRFLPMIMGRTATTSLRAGTPLSWEMVDR